MFSTAVEYEQSRNLENQINAHMSEKQPWIQDKHGRHLPFQRIKIKNSDDSQTPALVKEELHTVREEHDILRRELRDQVS